MSKVQKIIFATLIVLFAILAGAVGYGLGSSNNIGTVSNSDQDESQSQQPTSIQTMAATPDPTIVPTATTHQDVGHGELGDYTVSILNHDILEDYEGNRAIRVYFEFTNNSSDATSFMFAIHTIAFQDGVELELAIVLDRVTDDDNALKKIKPGTTLTCTSIYVLDSESQVQIEASEYFSLDGAVLTSTFNVG